MSERPAADPIITALRLALAEITARRATEKAESRGKMSVVLPHRPRRDAA
jgi:hypothetical protein